LLTVARTLGPFHRAVLLEASAGAESPRQATPDGRALPDYEVWGLPVRYGGTPVESVSLGDAALLKARIRAWIGGGP
jgi:hypothetical protein